jgi:ABC-type phosphate transport system substrate-binding protein
MALIVPIVVLAVAWLALSVPRWRQFSWRDQMDTPLDLLPKEARASGAWAAWKVMVNQREVALPSLVMLRVRNSGLTSISEVGIRRPLTFTFPGREVVEYAVTDCRGGVSWDMIQPPGRSEGSVIGNRIILPRFRMQRRASFKLLVLLTGTGHGVLGKGRFRGGRMVHETRRKSPRVRNIAFGTALALLVGAQAGVALGEGPPIPAFCRSGQLNIQGSSAFAPAASQIAQAYSGTCPGATITVTGNGSFFGIDALNASGVGTAHSAETVQIAMSDGPVPPGFGSLVPHRVAVIIFAMVVNRQAGVFNLTTRQLQEIFRGAITNWRQVGGADLPVTLVARASTSGTRHTFETKVLGFSEPPESSDDCRSRDRIPHSDVLLCEEPTTGTLLQQVGAIPGAIGYAQIADADPYANNVKAIEINASDPAIGAVVGGTYPFWTVEHLYTYGEPKAGSLTESFLNYMTSAAATDVLIGKQYTPCNFKQVPMAAALCKGPHKGLGPNDKRLRVHRPRAGRPGRKALASGKKKQNTVPSVRILFPVLRPSGRFQVAVVGSLVLYRLTGFL